MVLFKRRGVIMVFSRDERKGGDGKEACGPRNLKNEKQKTKKGESSPYARAEVGLGSVTYIHYLHYKVLGDMAKVVKHVQNQIGKW
jgi:hypothetical protein